MKVPMLDLRAQYRRIKDEIDAVVAEVFATQVFVGGEKVEGLEKAIMRYTGASRALAVASGTDALLLLLRAMGVRPGDEVITTPFSFFATAGAIANVGAKPVFVDIDPVTFNIDVAQVEARITERTRAVIPVHLYGQCADMDALMALNARHPHLYFLEDAAQALGARYKERPACTLGHAGAVSFYPSKNLGGAGDGGMVLTREKAIADQVALLRAHGADATYYHQIVGTNNRLDALQAAVLLVKLGHLDTWNKERRERAAYYTERFSELSEVTVPTEAAGNYHVYHQYVIRVPRRDALRDLMKKRGIGCAVFYPVPLHQQKCFQHLGYRESDCPEASKASREVLALPMYAELPQADQDIVIETVKEHLAQR